MGAGTKPPDDLERYRTYLQVLARGCVPRDLQARVGESDVVSDVLLAALADADRFRGWNEAQIKAYLRKMLASRVIDTARAMRRQARDPARERRIEQDLHSSAAGLDRFLQAQVTAVPHRVQRRESQDALLQAIATLPADQFFVVEQRRLRGRTVRAIAEELGRSEAAVRKLEARALIALRRRLGTGEDA